MKAQPDARADREHLVLLGLLQEELLHLVEPLGLLRGEISGLRKVRLEIVELPDILGRIPGCQPGRDRQPRNERPEGRGEPAIVIDAAAAIVVEVLRVLVVGARWPHRTCRAMLTPSIGSCLKPSTTLGGLMPRMS